MTQPLVSVVLPVFNRPEGLVDAVASALAQDYRPIEILVVDDGSTDSTLQVAESLALMHPEVQVIRQSNAGPGVARETGRQAAKGDYLQYLDSDDLLLPGKLSRQVRALEDDPRADAAYGWVRFRQIDGSVFPYPWAKSSERCEEMFPRILVERWYEATVAVLYRAAICRRAGPWLAIRNEEDWEYDCRVGVLGARLAFVDDYVCEVRDHPGFRLSRDPDSRRKFRDRAVAHAHMYKHANASGLDRGAPEFREFARRLFLLARQCGALGLAAESQQLFGLARQASTRTKRWAPDFVLYGLVAHVAGWTAAGRLAERVDKARARGRPVP